MSKVKTKLRFFDQDLELKFRTKTIHAINKLVNTFNMKGKKKFQKVKKIKPYHELVKIFNMKGKDEIRKNI